MEKLSDENIQFIDRYLKNSGVEYLDIRLEMTDHVASEIESRMEEGDSQGFYSIFKQYMVANKASLLKGLKAFRKEADKKVLKKVLLNLFHPKTLIITGFIALALYLSLTGFDLDLDLLRPYFYLPLFGIYSLPYIFLGKGRYIYIDTITARLGGLNLILLNLPFDEVYHSPWFFMGMLLFNVSVLKALFGLVSYYKKNYKLS